MLERLCLISPMKGKRHTKANKRIRQLDKKRKGSSGSLMPPCSLGLAMASVVAALVAGGLLQFGPWPGPSELEVPRNFPLESPLEESSLKSPPEGPPSPSDDSPSEEELQEVLERRLGVLSYRGDLPAVRELLRRHGKKVCSGDSSGEGTSRSPSPVHRALQGRQDSFAQQSSELLGQHEAVVALLVGSGCVDACQGCPVYHALHYRNTVALELLLGRCSQEE